MGARVQQVRLPSGAATWTVIGGDGLSIEAAEEYLEYLRVSSSPNTVKSYARALALWWRWLEMTQVGWRDVGLSEVTGFVHWLRMGEDGTIVAFAPSAPKLSESTVAVRLQAVLSFYRYQALNGVPAAVALTQRIHRSSPGSAVLLRSDTVPADFIDGTQGHIRRDSERLWLSVPVELRRLHLVVGDTPEWEGRFSRGKKVCTLLDLRDLPEEIACEMLYAAWRLLDLGAAVHVGDTSTFLRDLRRALKACAPPRASLMDAPVERWEQDLLRACAGRRGKVPDRWDRQRIRSQLHRIYFAVYSAYDTRPWWRREIWDAENDPRIPLREHEPRTHACQFTDVHPLWLRDGLRYFLGMQMQTGALSMASARSYLISIRKFGRYLQDRGVQHPRLAEDREGLRDLVLGWRGEVASMRSERTGGSLSKSTAYQYLNQPENLYAWLLDHRADLSRAVGDDRWLALGIEHSRFYQPGERPRTSARAPDEEEVIEDAVMTRVLSVAGELGRDVSDGGAGDEQAERMLLLLAKTGRRVMEILQLDFDPLLALAGVSANDTDGFVAKLRYQQTKIEGAPDTILVDRETVAIIEAQQRWAREWLRSEGIDAEPKYLFMRPRMNRNADRCYAYATFRQRLSWLAETHDLRDSRGRPVVLTRTHRFRHTQATSLINAGVPLHVVQRYF